MAWYKSQVFMVIAALIAFLMIGLFSLSYLSKSCKPDPSPKGQVSADDPAKSGKPSKSKPTALQLLESIHQTQKAQYEADRREKQEKSWWHNFSCELKVTDFLLAMFTLWLVVVGAWQGHQLKRSVDLGREEFIAAHRPKMIVRTFAPMEKDEQTIGIKFSVHNVGDSSGTVVATSGRIWFPSGGEDLPAIPEYEPPVARNQKLGSGEWIECVYLADEASRANFSLLVGFHKVRSVDPEERTLLFLGYIDYTDESGRKRQTAFLRNLDFKTGRFNPINHPDYEYQD